MSNSNHPKLNARRLDDLFQGPEKIWGLQPIADVLGVSIDKARKIANSPHSPIYQPGDGKRHFAFRSELVAWLRTKAVR